MPANNPPLITPCKKSASALALPRAAVTAFCITDAGAWLLATAREMSPIVRLNLSGNDIGPDAARALRNRYGDGLTL